MRPAPTGTARLLACGLMGPILLVAGVLAQDALRPGYNPLRQFVSHLSLGPHGWMNSVLLVVSGGLVALFAVGFRRVQQRDRRARAIWMPVCVLGVGLMAAGVFTIDPGLGYPPGSQPQHASWHGTVHDIAGGIVFLAAVAATVMTGRRIAGSGRRRTLANMSYGVAMMIVILFALTSVLAGLDYAGSYRPGLAGLAERAYLTTTLLWVMALARQALRAAATTSAHGETRSGSAPALADFHQT